MVASPLPRTHISFDWALKRLLRQKSNFVILEGFLTELLGMEIKILQLHDSESNKDGPEAKGNRVDLLCETEGQELVIIELQYYKQSDYFLRMLFGVSRLISEYMQMGDAYQKVRKVYSVNIVYFDLGHGRDYIYHGRLHFQGIHHGDELLLRKKPKEGEQKKWAGELFPEYYVLKINNFDGVAKSPLDEWIYYFKNSRLPQQYQAKGLTAVDKELNFALMTPEQKAKYQRLIDDQLVTEDMLQTYWSEGKEEGIETTISKMVCKMFRKGMPIGEIALFVEISEEKATDILRSNELL